MRIVGAFCGALGLLFSVPLWAEGANSVVALGGEARNVARDTLLATRFGAALERVEQADDDAPRMRGAHEARLFDHTAPAVVLILSLDDQEHANGLGSGSVLNSDGQILTNMHVVDGADRVAVIFRPRGGNVDLGDIRRADLFTARVEKVDAVRDLALLRLETHPDKLTTLSLGTMDGLSIGADVHAIGHPEGATWSYTKGIVSQIRQNAEWSYSDERRKHHATVIQTQTPINPGNSGGPLIDDTMHLVGVNTYSRSDAQGMNYAVSVDEVKRFIAEPARATEPPPEARSPRDTGRTKKPGERRPSPDGVDRSGVNSMDQAGDGSGANVSARPGQPGRAEDDRNGSCAPRWGKRERDAKNPAWRTEGDYDCSGRVNSYALEWDDAARGQSLHLDRNGDGKTDVVYYDRDRDGQAEQADFDTQYSGSFDVRLRFDGTGEVIQSMRLGK